MHEFDYFRSGPGKIIPPNSRITYQVELLTVESAVDLSTISVADRVKQA